MESKTNEILRGLIMDKSITNSNRANELKTTIGDLIEAISNIASAAGKTEKEGYELAAKMLEKAMKIKNTDKLEE